jgi:hypothetical protein
MIRKRILKERPQYTTVQMREMLRSKFSDSRYLFMEEVRDATGFEAGRSADAVAIGMYRTVGQLLWGFEIKVSRSDWLHELQQPEKSESFLRYCDRFALVVSDQNIVLPGELPEPWGMLAPIESQMKLSAEGEDQKLPNLQWVKECPALCPLPPDRVFLCAILSAATQFSMQERKRMERRWHDDGYEKGYQAGQSRTGESRLRNELESLRKTVHEFQDASGIEIDRYYGGKRLGELVQLAKDGDRLERSMRDDLFGWKLRGLEELVTSIHEFRNRFSGTTDQSVEAVAR